MASITTRQSLTVPELRERWLPHKERLNSTGSGHPTSVRFHRACSWLEEAERLDPEQQSDQILIHQWVAFNALYGQWDLDRHEPLADRESWREFLVRMLELDADGHIISQLKDNRGLVLAILGNGYLNRYFWNEPCCEKAGKAGRGSRHKAESWYTQKEWNIILKQIVDRIYLLRCQLVHGAATLGSKLNRRAPKHCTTMMGILMPTILLVWIEHGADEDWGLLCYPPVDDGASGVLRRRPR